VSGLDARILVVDDDPLNRDLLRLALEREGCEVTTADDGMRALRMLRGEPGRIDVVLLDVVMPEMDGYEVLRYLKGDPELARLPVIVVSALDDISSVVRCVELGADDYLTKPFDPVLLRARVCSSLARKRFADTERRYLRLLEDEEARTDRLVLNILPSDIAERLKRGESLIADHFDDVSVVFADLVGFTAFAAERPAAEVVALLDAVVSRFDDLAIAWGLEKIKTIGDAYLAVGGLSAAGEDHLAAALEMALQMFDVVERHGDGLQLRVGVHAGPVVAGVIGTHKFSYDLWGDTVNVASRMQSHGEPGRVHVTDVVAQRLGERFTFEGRGPMELKHRGTMETFFLVAPERAEGRRDLDLREPSPPPVDVLRRA
jgi:class 3 adenylate cyclase